MRKIKSQVTLGQKLKRARKRMNVDITEAEIATKIRSKYLLALECDDYSLLPADAYTKGFVGRYAKYLKLDIDKTVAEFLRQKSHYRKFESSPINLPRSYREVKYIITPKLIAPVSVSLAVLAIFFYLAFQINGFAAAPELVISNPSNNSIIDSESVELRGNTNQQADVYVNEQKIQVSEDGSFAIDFQLIPGINVIQVKSRNKAQKEKLLTYTVEYKSQSARLRGGNE